MRPHAPRCLQTDRLNAVVEGQIRPMALASLVDSRRNPPSEGENRPMALAAGERHVRNVPFYLQQVTYEINYRVNYIL